MHTDDGPHAEIKCKASVELVELGIVRLQHFPPTIEPENEGRSLEGAEHNGDAAILLKMSDGLSAAAREVLIRKGIRIEDGKRVLTFRRDVDVTAVFQRSGGNEENVLLCDEGLETISYLGVDLTHHCLPDPSRFATDLVLGQRVSAALMRL